jgi:hypothetical protein
MRGKPKSRSLVPASTRLPPAARKLFSEPELAPGEDRKVYERVVKEVFAALQPHDFIASIFVQDIADWEWRKRRWKSLEGLLLGSAEASKRASPRTGFDSYLAYCDWRSVRNDYDETHPPPSEE